MSAIPPHYSERFVNQRYSKALHIVQNLPASSSFQPNKDEKLQLYSLYKQVSHGDIDTQRPGIFDVVGRAKWDAWKKLQGLSTLEAKHQYVDTLLKVCTEAYRKPAAKAQVQQIIQAFATLQPTDSDDDDSDDSSIDDGQEDGETSESVDEEEQAYLMDIQKSIPSMTTSKSRSTSSSTTGSDTRHSQRSPVMRSSFTSARTKQSNRRSWHGKPPPRPLRRAPSIESTQSMMTAPSVPFRRPPSRSSAASLTTNTMRPTSTMSHRSDLSRHLSRRTPHTQQHVSGRPMTRQSMLGDDDHFGVNPWAVNQPGTTRRYKLEPDDLSDDSIDEQYSRIDLQPTTTTPVAAARIPSHSSVSSSSYYQRPLHPHEGAPPPPHTTLPPDPPRLGNRLLTEQQYTSVVALGPATKRALETLQAEIIGLNERIDGLRQELIDRDDVQKKRTLMTTTNDEDDDEAALKHTAVNLVAAILIVVFLSKRGNPIADALIASLYKQWVRLGFAKLVR
ncbi:hypothetical protein [Absidia glauca]|uniref:ACB domain-containing protein n=1 Tax=Absidia glauca TaxID=4829 RepID=A0A163K6H2_ABSGL|nr:hypothetical protein [Absidia glauca]